MKRSVDFPDVLIDRLKKMADQKGVNVSVIIKMACKEYLDKEENKK